ncbi:MAG: hypothetical protein ACOX63_02445 [Christensenellales bacterium]
MFCTSAIITDHRPDQATYDAITGAGCQILSPGHPGFPSIEVRDSRMPTLP